MPSTAPLLRFKRTTIWPLVLWKSHFPPVLGTLVPLGKNQFPLPGWLQQAVWLVTQLRALSPSPMSSRATQLLFWYVVPLSENQTSPAPGKFEYSKECKRCSQNLKRQGDYYTEVLATMAPFFCTAVSLKWWGGLYLNIELAFTICPLIQHTRSHTLSTVCTIFTIPRWIVTW